MSGDGDYGQLGSNMVATGGTRAVSYTQGILLGTVDFSKLSDTHTFGVVYMEAVQQTDIEKPFDYNLNLVYNGDGVTEERVNTTADGKFEKQLVGLMPGTTYYYRSYIKIGSTYNYADVKYFSTLDPSSQINLVTGEAEDVCALSSILVGRASIGNVNNGLDQAEIRNQQYGFIISDDAALSTPETLTIEYWENWDKTHFDTQKKPDEPLTLPTKDNINSVLQQLFENLIPGTTYYYRTVFVWNDRYFYSPEVKSFTTLGPSTFTVGTLKPEDLRGRSATLIGTIPYDKIGARNGVPGGFMISKKYSNRNEFVMNDKMNRWPSSDDISYIECEVDGVQFSKEIEDLTRNTQYYVCAFVELGREKDTVDKYGNVVKGKKIYLYGDPISFTTPDSKADIEIIASDDNSWEKNDSDQYTTNASYEESALFIQVEADERGQLTFDWSIDSDSTADAMKIYVVPYITETIPSTTSNLRGTYRGTRSDRFSYTSSYADDFTVVVVYEKDDSNSTGHAMVSNISYK